MQDLRISPICAILPQLGCEAGYPRKNVHAPHYREETVNARIDFINNHSKTSQKILLIGTHIDKAPSNYQSEVEKCFACKRYRDMLKKAIYIDTTKKECVEKVHKALYICND